MITENGTIKVSTQMDGKVNKEFLKPQFKMGIAFTVIGAIGVTAFLVLDIVSIFLDFEDNLFFMSLVCFAIVLGLGISLLILVNKAVNTAQKDVKTCTYEFFKDYFITTETSNGETVATVKFYNTQIIKSKETANYLFFYVNTASACPVLKSGLTDAELNTLRSIFKLPANGEIIELSAEEVQSQTDAENTQKTDTENTANADHEEPFGEFKKPDEPFDEFKN